MLAVGSPADFVPLVNLGGRLQFLGNGSLWLEGALPYDEGHYMCRAENGVGSPLTKTIFVAINGMFDNYLEKLKKEYISYFLNFPLSVNFLSIS